MSRIATLNETVHSIRHGFVMPGNKSLEIHNYKGNSRKHRPSRDLKAVCSPYLGLFLIAEDKTEFCLFVSNE